MLIFVYTVIKCANFMDQIDFNILKALQANGRLTNVELAEKVNLSPSPCLRRVKRLENDNVLTSYSAHIDRAKVGLSMTVFVDISLDTNKHPSSDRFEQAIIALDNVVSAHLVSGLADYRIEVVVPNLKTYEEVLKLIQNLPMVNSINSNFAIRSFKTSGSLPLG